MIRILKPGARIANRKKIAAPKLDELYEQEKEKVKKNRGNCNAILVSNFVSSLRNEKLNCYIDISGVLKNENSLLWGRKNPVREKMNIPKCKTNIEEVKMLIISTPVLCTGFTRRGIVT